MRTATGTASLGVTERHEHHSEWERYHHYGLGRWREKIKRRKSSIHWNLIHFFLLLSLVGHPWHLRRSDGGTPFLPQSLHCHVHPLHRTRAHFPYLAILPTEIASTESASRHAAVTGASFFVVTRPGWKCWDDQSTFAEKYCRIKQEDGRLRIRIRIAPSERIDGISFYFERHVEFICRHRSQSSCPYFIHIIVTVRIVCKPAMDHIGRFSESVHIRTPFLHNWRVEGTCAFQISIFSNDCDCHLHSLRWTTLNLEFYTKMLRRTRWRSEHTFLLSPQVSFTLTNTLTFITSHVHTYTHTYAHTHIHNPAKNSHK